jgi:hypothetical protein
MSLIKAYQKAQEVGMEIEVIEWALKELYEDEDLSPAEAMWIGVGEWCK